MSTKFHKEKVIRPKDIQNQFGICHRTVYNWIKAHVLPEPRSLGPQMVGWFESDLDAFYQSCKPKH